LQITSHRHFFNIALNRVVRLFFLRVRRNNKEETSG
jgi:hypothetical protein